MRVLIWGYNSKLEDNASEMTIANFAKDLLVSITAFRRSGTNASSQSSKVSYYYSF
jgi:hypothetical protein